MTTQLCSRRRVAVFRAVISAVALLSVLAARERVMAAPVSAPAYGTACHTDTPMLNAFGRSDLDDFARGKTLLQAAYLGNATGVSPFGDAHDYSRGADRPLQRRVSYADPAKPYEVGAFGETSALGVTGAPSFRCEFATDSNPGYSLPRVASNPIQPAGSTPSIWRIGSARQMVEHDHGTVNFTYYQTNQALGQIGATRLIPPNGVQTGGGPGFSYAINPYTRFYTTVSLQNQRPALSILMRFKPPLWSHLK